MLEREEVGRSNGEQAENEPQFADHTLSTVYFIGAENGLVKIGFAANFRERLGKLRCGSPVPLEVLAETNGGRLEERAYHSRFNKWRHHGEWFELVPEIQAEIDDINAEWERRIRPEGFVR
jgi:hypothetical protein